MCSGSEVKKTPIEYTLLCTVFIVLVLSGLFSYQKLTEIYFRSNLLPANLLLELTLIFVCFFQFFKRILISDILLSMLMLGFVISVFLMALWSNQKYLYISDFLLIYKCYIYLAMLPLIPRNILTVRNLYLIYRVIVIGLFLKYLISKIIYGIPRPSIFFENNFELVLPILMFCVLKYFKIPVSKIYDVFLFLSVILSLSLSAIGLLAIACFFLYKGKGTKDNLKNLFIYLVIFCFCFIAVTSRIDSIESIDRVVFFGVFLGEAESFTLMDWLFGKPTITPLRESSCEVLSFYDNLFSSNNSNICFSVILHSFILRTIFDHGILGLIFITAMFFYFINRSLSDTKISLLITGLVFLNGLSVSSFNNIFFLIAFLLIVAASNSLKFHGLDKYA